MDSVTVFLEAVERNDNKKVVALLGEDPYLATCRDRQGRSALLLAAYQGHKKMVKLLIPDIPVLTIFEAAAVGDIERVKNLVERDSERLRASSSDGFAPLGLAAYFGHYELVEYLLQVGAEVNRPSRNVMERRPIHSAVGQKDKRNAMRLTRRLLEAGADPNVRQSGGATPLHQAVARSHIPMVELLLKHGAEMGLRNDNRKTAVHLAEMEGEDEILEMFAICKEIRDAEAAEKKRK